ncbi:hypothetical protein SO802_029566 [Lithocarpus litseifolius]|uniref:CCHC-type domain-containing protein n=1 Tax=Lithocarpus litseifolius TaxID=425828 RepID=A0AAW2BW32_9ROSI
MTYGGSRIYELRNRLVQVWGLPFEFLFEEVGKEIGSKLSEVIEVDKRSWQADQAKFMRIRVNLPIHKSLTRGAHITNAKREIFWVTLKYERLPTFCFICGKLGHDDKHCTQNLEGQQINQQYGEWIRAGGRGKGSAEKARPTSSRSHESMEEEVTEPRLGMVPKNRDTSIQTMSDGNEARTWDQDLENRNVEMLDTIKSNLQGGWDNMEKVEKVLAQVRETRNEQNGTKPDLVRELFRSNEEGFPLVGLPQKPNIEVYGVKSPERQSGTTEDIKNKAQDMGSDKEKKAKAKCSLKKVAREMGKSQYVNKKAQVSIGGKKRAGVIEGLEESECRA